GPGGGSEAGIMGDLAPDMRDAPTATCGICAQGPLFRHRVLRPSAGLVTHGFRQGRMPDSAGPNPPHRGRSPERMVRLAEQTEKVTMAEAGPAAGERALMRAVLEDAIHCLA